MESVTTLSVNQISDDNVLKQGGTVNQAYIDDQYDEKPPLQEANGSDMGDDYSTVVMDKPTWPKLDEANNVAELTVIHGGRPYAGMGKDELLLHSSKRLWKTMRWVCIALVLLTWLALIAAVIALIVIHPRCKSPPAIKWWQKGVFYRIFVRSFQDSNGDGIGDLRGIESRLDYLKKLGVNALMLSSIYEYDLPSDLSIRDHKAVDPDYGTMAELESLVNATHAKGLYLILDFIPNHTSVLHPWFVNSSASASLDNPRRNFYVWAEGRTATTPRNNWKSVYSGSAWSKAPHQLRGEYYLHQFLASQPDLNLRNPDVQQELEDILKFWLDKGVDGFYIRQSAYMFEDYNLEDEEPKEGAPINSNAYASYDHARTYALPEVGDMFARWRSLLTEYRNDDSSNTRERFLTADIDMSHADRMNYYGYFGRDGVNFPLNSVLTTVESGTSASEVKRKIDSWIKDMPEYGSANWMLGDENIDRLLNRTSDDEARLLLMAACMLPGAPIIYYGDELGLFDVSLDPEPNVWEMEGTMRAPMRWDNSNDTGFLPADVCNNQTCTPWMPFSNQGPEYSTEYQNASSDSILSLVRNLTALRSDGSLQYGIFQYIISDENVVAFLRAFDGTSNYLTVLNFGNDDVTSNFENEDSVIETVTVKVTSGNGVKYKAGDEISTKDVRLKAKQGIVLKWDYQIKEYV